MGGEVYKGGYVHLGYAKSEHILLLFSFLPSALFPLRLKDFSFPSLTATFKLFLFSVIIISVNPHKSQTTWK